MAAGDIGRARGRPRWRWQLTHTVPSAVRLGHRADGPAEQTRLARSVCRDHLICAGSMLAFLVLWVAHTAAT